MKNNQDKKENQEDQIDLAMKDEEIISLKLTRALLKKKIDAYQKETGKYAIWRGTTTESFKRYINGEKIYDRDKERISLYVSDETKEKWQDFIKNKKFSTISKLIRESVDYFIDQNENVIGDNLLSTDLKKISNISHALKQPLTTIKGFSQLLLENHKTELNEVVSDTIKNIFEQSILLEETIVNILDDIEGEQTEIDILLIEDDIATIRLITTFFENKGYNIKGVISASKGIQALKKTRPKLILLDIILPDLSGFDLCKQIKTNDEFKDIPVIFITAIPGSEVEKNIARSMADGYILKPFDFADFDILFQFL